MVPEIVLFVFIVGLLVKYAQRPENFPPGPIGIPFLGNLSLFSKYDPKYSFKAMQKLGEKYGSVMGYYMGPTQPMVSVCGYQAVKEALGSNNLNGRPIVKTTVVTDGSEREHMGITFTEGLFWEEQRDFIRRHLCHDETRTRWIQNFMLDQIQDFINELRVHSDSDRNQLVDFKGIFIQPVVTILWALINGRRNCHDEAFIRSLRKSLVGAFHTKSRSFQIDIQLPEFLYKMFPVLRNYFCSSNNSYFKAQKKILEAIQRCEDTPYKKTKSDVNEPASFISVYLNELGKRQEDSKSTFSREQLLLTILDLFSAGMDTASNSIGFALLYLLHHPAVQQKMQVELDGVCGSRLPTFQDRSKLVYVEAVLTETMRLSNVVPITVPHCAMDDTKLAGYTIPKGSFVSMNIYSVHTDSTYWIDAEVFRPERHLDNEGKLVRTEHFIPFGAGKRKCAGESIASDILYLFTASLIKSFNITTGTNEPLPTLEPKEGFTLGYQGFKAVITAR